MTDRASIIMARHDRPQKVVTASRTPAFVSTFADVIRNLHQEPCVVAQFLGRLTFFGGLLAILGEVFQDQFCWRPQVFQPANTVSTIDV